MASILVTGGTGFIGSHTVVRLLEEGHDVVIVDNGSNSSPDLIDTLFTLTGKKIPFYPYDIRDTDRIMCVFAAHPCDAVIHFAALKAVGESCENPFLYYSNNILGTISLLQCMEAYGVSTLLFSSSCTVYDTVHGKPPFDEQSPLGNTTNPYGTSKFVMEALLRDLALYKGFSCIALRYFNPIGAHPSGLLGENPTGTPTNIFPLLLQAAAGERASITVFGGDYATSDGSCIRDYIHIMDIAQGHCLALDYLLDAKAHNRSIGFDAFNLGTGTGTSVFTLIDAVERGTQKSIPYTIGPRRPGDAPISVANPQKAQQHLQRTAKYTVDDAVTDGRRFYTRRHVANTLY